MKQLILIILLFPFVAAAQSVANIDTVLMGSSFSFTAKAETDSMALSAVKAGLDEVVRIEKLISSWDENSQTSEINRQAGIAPVKVDPELYYLIERANRISGISNGYFDVSFASISKVWTFTGDQTTNIPTDEELKASVELIDYRNVILDQNEMTVFLKLPGMRIGFGAIGKGYAADRAKLSMIENGAESGVVNAGGDLTAWGTEWEHDLWKVGIQDPNVKSNVLMWLNAKDQAIVTSGNYERYVTIKGKRYSHIIDPKTGWPVEGTKSVTVIGPTAELADALATTVFVLGVKDGLALINRMKGIEAVIIDDMDEVHYSKNIQTKTYAVD